MKRREGNKRRTSKRTWEGPSSRVFYTLSSKFFFEVNVYVWEDGLSDIGRGKDAIYSEKITCGLCINFIWSLEELGSNYSKEN